MFANTLEDIMELQSQRFPDNRLPWILTKLTDNILLLNGLQTEGIFRYIFFFNLLIVFNSRHFHDRVKQTIEQIVNS